MQGRPSARKSLGCTHMLKAGTLVVRCSGRLDTQVSSTEVYLVSELPNMARGYAFLLEDLP